ncbi:hypothetical protein LTR85_000063 [Meristemomyces frigidus]|nr:hypothetical protein LTR85_000063 [Meristemomyces frigidus]
MAAGFTEHASWRGTFWLISPVALIIALALYFALPAQTIPKAGFFATVKNIDWVGIMLSVSSTLLLLIPVSGIGSQFAAASPMIISMLTLGGICAVLFMFNEWRWAKLPMIPLRLFKNIALAAMIVQNFLIGIVFYSMLYFLPIYFQAVKRHSLIASAALVLPVVVAQSIASILSGQYISRLKRYGEVLWVGYICWTIGAGLSCMLSINTSPVAIAFILAVEGFGVGLTFQPTLVAAQAHSPKQDRAVVISVRNWIRAYGGAVGLAVASVLFSNIVKSRLPSTLPVSAVQSIDSAIFSSPRLDGLSDADKDAILRAYMDAFRSVDRGLARKSGEGATAGGPPGTRSTELADDGGEKMDTLIGIGPVVTDSAV